MAFDDNDVMEKGGVSDIISSEPYHMKQSTLNFENVSQTKYSPSEFSTGTIAIILDCLCIICSQFPGKCSSLGSRVLQFRRSRLRRHSVHRPVIVRSREYHPVLHAKYHLLMRQCGNVHVDILTWLPSLTVMKILWCTAGLAMFKQGSSWRNKMNSAD